MLYICSIQMCVFGQRSRRSAFHHHKSYFESLMGLKRLRPVAVSHPTFLLMIVFLLCKVRNVFSIFSSLFSCLLVTPFIASSTYDKSNFERFRAIPFFVVLSL